MLGVVQKLLKREEPEGFFAKGVLEKNDIRTVKSPRKNSYKTWLCGNCGHLYFYAVVRCPLCESDSVSVVNSITPAYNFKDMVVD